MIRYSTSLLSSSFVRTPLRPLHPCSVVPYKCPRRLELGMPFTRVEFLNPKPSSMSVRALCNCCSVQFPLTRRFLCPAVLGCLGTTCKDNGPTELIHGCCAEGVGDCCCPCGRHCLIVVRLHGKSQMMHYLDVGFGASQPCIPTDEESPLLQECGVALSWGPSTY